MRGVFERGFRAAAVAALLLVLAVPAVHAEDDDPSAMLGARINPPIGATSVEEPGYFELFLMWAEMRVLFGIW